MKNKIKEFRTEIANIKKEYPLYKPFSDIEYQLDADRVVIGLSYPYENLKNSDDQLEYLFDLKVDEVYDFIKEVNNERVYLIVSDTTEGNFKHNDTLENTLKEFSELFHPNYCAGREWVAV